MTAPKNEHGLYEITVPVKFVFDPAMVGQDLSQTDLLDEAQIALNTMSSIVDRGEVQR
jgi:DNA-binding Xre family transcriptional regulator